MAGVYELTNAVFHTSVDDKGTAVMFSTLAAGSKIKAGEDSKGKPDDSGAVTVPQDVVDKLQRDGVAVPLGTMAAQTAQQMTAQAQMALAGLPPALQAEVRQSIGGSANAVVAAKDAKIAALEAQLAAAKKG